MLKSFIKLYVLLDWKCFIYFVKLYWSSISYWQLLAAGSGEDSLPLDNKPLPELMLTKTHYIIRYHYAIMSKHFWKLNCTYTVHNATQELWVTYISNSSPPGQNGCHFADNCFKLTFVNEKFCIWIRISVKFVPKSQVDNKSAKVQVMTWCWIGNKPLPKRVLTQFTNAYMRH